MNRSWPITIFLPGLTLKLNVSQNEYTEDLTEEAGLRIHIGDQGQLSEPYERGFSLAPGFSYYVAVGKVNISAQSVFFFLKSYAVAELLFCEAYYITWFSDWSI